MSGFASSATSLARHASCKAFARRADKGLGVPSSGGVAVLTSTAAGATDLDSTDSPAAEDVATSATAALMGSSGGAVSFGTTTASASAAASAGTSGLAASVRRKPIHVPAEGSLAKGCRARLCTGTSCGASVTAALAGSSGGAVFSGTTASFSGCRCWPIAAAREPSSPAARSISLASKRKASMPGAAFADCFCWPIAVRDPSRPVRDCLASVGIVGAWCTGGGATLPAMPCRRGPNHVPTEGITLKTARGLVGPGGTSFSGCRCSPIAAARDPSSPAAISSSLASKRRASMPGAAFCGSRNWPIAADRDPSRPPATSERKASTPGAAFAGCNC
mmetsp:Transcript_98964/g.229277  ORF Transcript_98964/g.229277 Transcript_98964/m.229277 type:complete len:334 (-) Transcript_98964:781-1782(-)